jgi:hypothetical protein
MFIGICSVVLIIGGLSGLYISGNSEATIRAVSSGMWRVGLTLGALWLAFPQLAAFFKRWPPILVAGYAVGLIAVAINSRSRVVILPAAIILTVLHISGYLLPQTKHEKPSQR